MDMVLIITQVALFTSLIIIVAILKKYFISDWATLIRVWGWAMIGIASLTMLTISVMLLFMGNTTAVLLPMVIGSMAGIIFSSRKFFPRLFRRIQSFVIVAYVAVSLGLVAFLYNSGSF